MSKQVARPAIVVVAYNRVEPLRRILGAVARASYNGYENVPLIISVDKSSCIQAREIADQFTWMHGTKRVVAHEVRLGLRNHVIYCGDLTDEYDAVILLEDDLFVSPAFYDYAVQAMHFYRDQNDVCGVSLYSCDFNEYARMRFWAIDDGYDNYFVQSASSWGQLWTRKQWGDFKNWYVSNVQSTIGQGDPLPDGVIEWPESSWKKYFIKYMVLEKKYFVYPRVALATNVGDKGTHTKSEIGNVRVPLALRSKRYNFSLLDDCACIYDGHYEIEARCLALFNNELGQFDFECDLYGTKRLEKVKTRYLLSLRDCAKPIISYAMKQVPHELNVIFNLRGDFFHLAKVGDFGVVQQRKRLAQLRWLHKDLGLRRYGTLFFRGLLERIGL